MPAPTPGTYVNGTAGAATSASVTAPGGRTVGQPLTGHVYLYNAGFSIPAPSGWTLINQTAASSFQIASYWRAATGDASDNFTASGWSSTYCHAGMLPYSGASTSRAIDAIGADNAGSSTTPSAREVITSLADCLLVYCSATDSAATARPPSGFTQHDSNSGVFVATAAQALAGASGDKTGSISGAAQPWAAHMFAIAPTGVVIPVTRRMLLLGVGS